MLGLFTFNVTNHLFLFHEGARKAALVSAVSACGKKPCQNGGTCLEQGSSEETNSDIKAVTCLCAPGFQGKTCDEGENELDLAPLRLWAELITFF